MGNTMTRKNSYFEIPADIMKDGSARVWSSSEHVHMHGSCALDLNLIFESDVCDGLGRGRDTR